MRYDAGQLIGDKYRIVRPLGEGAMGAVYEAEHVTLRARVALKFLHRDLLEIEGIGQRFLREASISARIKHQHAVQVTDVDILPDHTPYLVMEMLEGETLQDLIDRHPAGLPYPRVVDYSLQLLAGLQAAHDLGVVHRDLKPANVFVVGGNAGGVLKILDFGIAKLEASAHTPAGQRDLTRPGTVMGTPEYMAPEQAFSADAVTPQSDLYSLGVMMYEMLTGQLPAEGESPQAIASLVLLGHVRRVSELCQVPDALANLIHRAMSPRPDARPSSAFEMRQALVHFATNLSLPGQLAAHAELSSLANTHRGTRKVPLSVQQHAQGAPEAAELADVRPGAVLEAGPRAPLIRETNGTARTVQYPLTDQAPALAREATSPMPAVMAPVLPVTEDPLLRGAPSSASRTSFWRVAFFIVLVLSAVCAGLLWYYQDYWWNTAAPPPLPRAR